MLLVFMLSPQVKARMKPNQERFSVAFWVRYARSSGYAIIYIIVTCRYISLNRLHCFHSFNHLFHLFFHSFIELGGNPSLQNIQVRSAFWQSRDNRLLRNRGKVRPTLNRASRFLSRQCSFLTLLAESLKNSGSSDRILPPVRFRAPCTHAKCRL